MFIESIQSKALTLPMVKTFKTALRSIDHLEYVLVEVKTGKGMSGIGGAAPSAVITGETTGSILAAVDHIAQQLKGMDAKDPDGVFRKLNGCMVGNGSAKAAVDMALYDLLAKSEEKAVFQFLNGSPRTLITDMTIGIDTVPVMEKDCKDAVKDGFSVLKIKVGHDPDEDIRRLISMSEVAGPDVALRIDANQGWTPKQALRVADAIAAHKLNVQLMEQPVKSYDIKGMAFVRSRTSLPVYADESLFSPVDALRILDAGAADGFNIKLMKCGGIYNALKIAAIAESAGIPCMIGSMMETSVSVAAAAHLACAEPVIRHFDLDAPLFCKSQPVGGGIQYQGSRVCLSEAPGLGFTTDTI